jgi:iron complex transport system substrate-binding protein
MPAFASTFAISIAAVARVASLNLCTDETLLMLARPGEIASLSYLSQVPSESALWRTARRFPRNDGSLESALSTRPTVLLTMGGGGRATALIARRLGLKVVDLPFPSNLAEVEAQWTAVAAVLGDPSRAGRLRGQLQALQATVPARLTDAAYMSGGGQSLGTASLGAQWMRLAGLRQRSLAGDRLTLETLVNAPPKLLLRSTYRLGQASRGTTWMRHPLVTRLAPRTRATDGRAWTCAGAPMLAEVRRLRDTVR